MSNHNTSQSSKHLVKHHSCLSDINRNEAWLCKKKKRPLDRRSKSVTNDDLEELKGCMELGFGFEPDSPEMNLRLSHTIPALDLYVAVHRQYNNHLSPTSSFGSERDVGSTTIVDKGDDKKTMKQKLKQWAKVVGFSVRQFPRKPN